MHSPAGGTYRGTAAKPAGAGTVTCESKEICPVSGLWEIIDLVSTAIVVRDGTLMPMYYGRAVVWMLIRAG